MPSAASLEAHLKDGGCGVSGRNASGVGGDCGVGVLVDIVLGVVGDVVLVGAAQGGLSCRNVSGCW